MADRKKSPDDIFNNPMFVDRSKEWEGMGFIIFPGPIYCPKCGSFNFKEILYGMPVGPPDPEIYYVGGCVVSDEQWHCANCEHEW